MHHTFVINLEKNLGNKKCEITPKEQSCYYKVICKILKKNEHCQIYDNTEFIYREYAVMQPLQRNYAITKDRINAMLSSGALSTLYDEAKVDKLEIWMN
mgnify:CR=1 FL=1